MSNTINWQGHLKLYAVIALMAALLGTLLAAGMIAGPAQAQNSGNTYPDPQPCGPAAGTAFMEEPHEVTTGHLALFDAYWEWTDDASQKGVSKNKGIMHTNDCPPKMVTTKKDDGFGNVTVTTTRAASGIDVGEAIVHVLDKHKVDVVATNAEATAGQLSLEEYPDVRNALDLGPNDPVPSGTQVWWLRLDDPDTTAKDETSDLRIGFSTALFDEKYWLTDELDDGDAPMRYMIETARYRNIDPADAPHFFAYEAPKKASETGSEEKRAKLVLDSTRLDIVRHNMRLNPGEYRSLQWIFTKEGTYALSAHLQGFVREHNPYPSDDSRHANWKRISPKVDETSEVRDYVFQVGDKLAETEPPMFGVSRSVHEDASAGAHVGKPIRVFNAEVPDLTYTLSGDDHDKFSVNSRTHPLAAQIVVAAGANLDYDSKSSYDLVLGVSDGKDHEGNDDSSIDHSIAVKIDLIQQPHAYIVGGNHVLRVGESVTLRVNVWDMPDGVTSVADNKLRYTVWEKSSAGVLISAIFPVVDSSSFDGTATVSKNSAGTYKYTPTATYTLTGVEYTVHGDPVTITWRNP